MNIILMGPPGVGKGTQGRRLADKFKIPLVGAGDLFRHLPRDGSWQAREVAGYLARGDFVPDELAIELVLARLDRLDTRDGFILDGFPRTVIQAHSLDRRLVSAGRHIDRVVILDAPDETVLSRLSERWTCRDCDRSFNRRAHPPKVTGRCDWCDGPLLRRIDESADVGRHRLEVYRRGTTAVIDYYDRQGLALSVDAQGTEDEIEARVIQLLRPEIRVTRPHPIVMT